jgi:catechol 2,3-dioxygenase-like lactoylglutathione lyase family enzyme
MNRWSRGPLRVIFAFVIAFLAAVVGESALLIFHSRSDRIFGIGFFVGLLCLVPLFQRAFPTIYSFKRGSWDALGTAGTALALARRMFSSAGDVSLKVHDLEAARRWYSEKLKLPYSSAEVEEASMELGYSSDLVVICLVGISGDNRAAKSPGRPPIIFARRLARAHEILCKQGVEAGPIQKDSGGNQFFRFRDLEGNELEVCQEH